MTYKTVEVPLPLDDEGMIGRECPDPRCGRYFKLRLGTGLETDVCHCPYCGYAGAQLEFATYDQTEYAKSVAIPQITRLLHREINRSLKRLERQSTGGLISFKAKTRRASYRKHRYIEKKLETNVTCDDCALEFAIYGVFASCPDCQRLNALTTCLTSLDVARKRVRLSTDESIDAELRTQFPRDALRDSVATFDSFGKALRTRYKGVIRSRAKVNLFQDLDALDGELTKAGLPGIGAILQPDEHRNVAWLFQARHLLEHNAGVVDERFINRFPETASIHGRLLQLPQVDLLKGIDAIAYLARAMDKMFREKWQ